MSKNIKQLEINFNSEWFQSGYYVYVISITHNTKGIFYYIGQTGDRNNKSARSPFYRLMGHFNTYGVENPGTDAQLVKGLLNNNLIETPSESKKARICIEEAIHNKSIVINAYYLKITDFDNIDHHSKRQNVEEIELALINKFCDNKLRIFNDMSKIGTQKQVNNDESNKLAKAFFDKIMRQKGSKKAIDQLVKSNNFIDTINHLIKPTKAHVSIYDNWIPDANNIDKEAELKNFLKYNFDPLLYDKIVKWWLHGDTTTPNWDLISTCTIDGKRGILLVEAKAHKDELNQESHGKQIKADASDNSKNNHSRIEEAIQEANIGINKSGYDVSISIDNCYQLSNRVAHAWWLANQGIPVVLMYLGFLNCADMNDGNRMLFTEEIDWQECFKEHAQQVGVDSIINEPVNCGESGFVVICRSYEPEYAKLI
jgi:hypothetical protein